MKKTLLLFLLIIFLHLPGYSTQHIITNTGNAFTPETITINAGDTVVFQISNAHNAQEVSQDTWSANSGVPLPGGFQVPFGGGMVLPAQLTPGTHYFVCTPHAFLGMKGTIVVQGSTGIDDITSQNITLYPNPAQDYIHLKNYKHAESYIITDINGRHQYSGILQMESSTIDINNLDPGVYFIRFDTQKNKKVKFIKR